MGFLLCKGCQRHVRRDDAACPFCGSAELQGTTKVGARLARGAMLGAAAVALACSSSSPGDDAGTDAATQDSGYDAMQAAYGGPPDASAFDATPDGPAPAYGGPPVDSGTD